MHSLRCWIFVTLRFIVKYALALALSVLLTCTIARLGPVASEKHSATSLKEAVRQMRLSVDRGLFYFALLQALTEIPPLLSPPHFHCSSSPVLEQLETSEKI